MSTKTKIIFAIVLIGVILFGSYYSVKIGKNSMKDNSNLFDNLPSSHNLSSEDSSLIAQSFINQIKVIEIIKSISGEPFLILGLGERYRLIIHKIKVGKAFSFNNFINLEKGGFSGSPGSFYETIHGDIYNYAYKVGTTNKASEILLSAYSDSMATLAKDDSIFAVHFIGQGFSLKYSNDDPISIFVQGKKKLLGTKSFSADILFRKRDEDVIFYFLVPTSQEQQIDPNLLHRIVIGD
jgi:hypothetical protein